MNPVYLHVSWSVKFRAIGVTLGSYSDSKTKRLPDFFQILENIVHTPYNYNDHGIQISVSLSATP